MKTVLLVVFLALATVAYGQEDEEPQNECQLFNDALGESMKICYQEIMDGGTSALKGQTAVNAILRRKRHAQWDEEKKKQMGDCMQKKMKSKNSKVGQECEAECNKPCENEPCQEKQECMLEQVCKRCPETMMCKKDMGGKNRSFQ